jgi:cell pole-organizing protein PopZ
MSDASVTPEPSMDEILQKIQRIIAEDEKPESAPAPTPPPAPEIQTLTQAVGEGGTVRRLTPVEPAPEPVPQPQPEPPRPQERRIEPVPAAEAPRPAADRLMSDATAGAAATAFAQLAAIQREKRRADEFPMGLQARTLEDLVREMLRPILQGWLDQKLPEILERLVKAELTKALHDAGLE